MQFTHAGNDGVASLITNIGLKSGVFLGKAIERLGHIVLGLVVFGDNGQGDDWFRNIHGSHGQV